MRKQRRSDSINVYVRGSTTPTVKSINVSSLEKSISDNVRVSFELEGHKISDAEWNKITCASERLAAII